MSINKRPSVEAAYVASRVPSKHHLYVIGPYAARVSFASQQRRALNLIWAIDQDLRRSGDQNGFENKEVAIVGAGLAGLTAAVAVAALGGNVWNLEAQAELMSKMRTAKHRDIHPSINFWPQDSLEVTTYLPFLNWFHDSCDEVIARIVKEWDRLALKHGSQIKGVWRHNKLVDFEWRSGKWILEIDAPPKLKLAKDDFDILILATGFGAERFVANSDTPPYWNPVRDYISRMKDENSNPCTHYIVSGTGDGGVIEVLRLLFTQFRAGSIEASTSPMFSDKQRQQRIKFIESAAQKVMLDAALHEGFPVPAAIKNEISATLWDRYNELVSDDSIGLSISRTLQATRSQVPKVILLGEWSSPVELSTSPYHKLLLAYAVRNGYVDYYQVCKEAEVESAGAAGLDPELASNIGIQRKKINILARRRFAFGAVDKRLHIDDLADEPFSFDDCVFMSRHGYNSPMTELFRGDVVPKKIKLLQALYADQDWLTYDQADTLAYNLGEPHPSAPVKWLRAHLAMANDYFQKRYNLFAKEAADLEDPHYELQYIDDTPNDDNSLLYPRFFVGIPVNTDPQPAPRQASRTGH